VDALSFTDAALKVHASLALMNLGVDDSVKGKALSVLQKRLSDKESIVRLYAAMVAGRMGAEARPLVSDLILRVTDRDSHEIRRAAAYALGQAGQATRNQEIDMSAARALYGTFSGPFPDHCADVRLNAVMAFGGMGIPRDEASRQAIVQALAYATKTDKNKAVVIWAHVGLMAQNQPVDEHLPPIVKFLKDSDFSTHYQALRAIGMIDKKKAKSCIPELMKGLQDKDVVLQAMTVWVLGQMEEYAADAVPAIKELMERKDTNEGVKETCKDALAKIAGKPAADKSTEK
jgi:HEAT repeat protein